MKSGQCPSSTLPGTASSMNWLMGSPFGSTRISLSRLAAVTELFLDDVLYQEKSCSNKNTMKLKASPTANTKNGLDNSINLIGLTFPVGLL